MCSAEIRHLLSTGMLKLVDLFKSNHFQLRIAGGAVRDILMGMSPKDFDLATDATPSQMIDLFESNQIRMINSNGVSHGTVTARVDDQNYEVTTLRVDTATDGRRAQVKFTNDWEEDAGRRDLTVNSLFMEFDGTVIDYFGGIADIMQRRVRFVRDPAMRIREDYLRILRYFRFFARISTCLLHEDGTLEAIRENAAGLEMISGERILTELEKLFGGTNPQNLPSVIESMRDCRLFPYLGLPVGDLSEFRRFTARCLGNESVKFGTFISSLLPTLEDVAVFHRRTKMSNDCRNLCEFIVNYRDVFADMEYQEMHDLLVSKPTQVGKYHDMLRQLGIYTGLNDRAHHIIQWPVPRFSYPIQALKERGLSRDQVSAVVAKLKDQWRTNDYTMPTQENVNEIVHNILKSD